jgi:uncharacterized protein
VRHGLSIGENALEPNINIIGWLASVGMGLSLGLFGAGGSILTMPILIFLYRVEPYLATRLSLFIVGLVSVSGLVRERKSIEVFSALGFAVSAVLGMSLMRSFLLPMFPKIMWGISLNQIILIFFSVVMIIASLSMIFVKVKERSEEQSFLEKVVFLFFGFLIGMITGFVGAGGGFLIVPALVFLGRIPVRSAAATSLFVISLNSLWGFAVSEATQIPWHTVLEILGFSLLGMNIGQRISHLVPSAQLKQAFGVFVLLMGTYILFNSKGN